MCLPWVGSRPRIRVQGSEGRKRGGETDRNRAAGEGGTRGGQQQAEAGEALCPGKQRGHRQRQGEPLCLDDERGSEAEAGGSQRGHRQGGPSKGREEPPSGWLCPGRLPNLSVHRGALRSQHPGPSLRPESRAERQPQSCLRACLLAEVKFRSPGSWEEGRERQRQGAGGRPRRGRGCISEQPLTGGEAREWEGPTENKAEPGPARKASCH